MPVCCSDNPPNLSSMSVGGIEKLGGWLSPSRHFSPPPFFNSVVSRSCFFLFPNTIMKLTGVISSVMAAAAGLTLAFILLVLRKADEIRGKLRSGVYKRLNKTCWSWAVTFRHTSKGTMQCKRLITVCRWACPTMENWVTNVRWAC